MPFNINPPINVDPRSFYPDANIGGTVESAFKGVQMGAQAKADSRKSDFMKALDEVTASAGDFTKPEGQAKILQGLQAKGFGPEAMELQKAFPKEGSDSFSFDDTPGGRVSQNQKTGEVKLIPDIPSEKQSVKQAEDKFNSMKATLDGFMKPPATGWNPLKGEKANALSKAIAYMPADVLKTKVAQDWISNNKAEQQNTVFNPAGTLGRDIPSLRSRSVGNAKTYKGAKDALNAAEGDYANYLKDPNASTNRVDQQGIIDKYTAVSLGKAPTEAQLELAQAFPGIESWFDLASGKLKTGQIIPKAAVDEMMRNMRKTVINYGSTLKQQNATDTEAANLGGIDPARILAVPDNVITQDSTRFSNAPGQNPEKSSYSPLVIDLAKKALADPKATPEHKAAAKKVLGL